MMSRQPPSTLLTTATQKMQYVNKITSLLDRKNYCPKGTPNPYSDHPHSIGFDVTISAPHMVSLRKLPGYVLASIKDYFCGFSIEKHFLK